MKLEFDSKRMPVTRSRSEEMKELFKQNRNKGKYQKEARENE